MAIEVAPSGKRLRLRSTLPLPDGSWKQRRITTPIAYPAGMEQARKLAEKLGRHIELHRMGLDPFPFNRWFDEPPNSAGHRSAAVDGAGITGLEARASDSWATDYASRSVPAQGGDATKVVTNRMKACSSAVRPAWLCSRGASAIQSGDVSASG